MFSLFTVGNLSITKALTYQDLKASGITRDELEQSLDKCPETLKSSILKEFDDTTSGRTYHLDGTLVQSVENGKAVITADCNSIEDVEKLFLRIYGMIISIVGLVFMFAIGKGAVLMMSAGESSEDFEKGTTAFKNAVIYFVGYFFSYIFITFFIVGVLGLGTSTNGKFNLLCQNRIVFDITLGNNSTKC